MQIHFFPPDPWDYWQRLVRTDGLKVTAAGDNACAMRARREVECRCRWGWTQIHASAGGAWQDLPLVKEFSDEFD